MSLLNQFQNQIQDQIQAGTLNDMTQTTAGGSGELRLLPAGKAIAVLTGYIETGLMPREFQGKAKEPAREMRLIFTIVGGTGVNAEGAPEKYVLEEGKFPTISTYWTSVSNNEKAKAVKWFQRMRQNCFGTGNEVSFAQFLGRAFLLPITHTEGKRDGKATLYANIDPTTIDKPQDPMTLQPYKVPEVPDSNYRLLLWDAPTKEQWDSLFIETPEDAEKSRNYLQEHVLESLDYAGSKLDALLGGATAQQQAAVAKAAVAKAAVAKAAEASKKTAEETKSAIPDPD